MGSRAASGDVGWAERRGQVGRSGDGVLLDTSVWFREGFGEHRTWSEGFCFGPSKKDVVRAHEIETDKLDLSIQIHEVSRGSV